MHELSIAENVFEIAGESLIINRGKKLRSVKIKVGELAGVVPESLQFCFTAIAKGTAMEDAKLKIEKMPIIVHCFDCGKDSTVGNFIFQCPGCENPNVEVISGNELQVVEIEIDV
ncbi:MAG: hydrogenase maturation nickel metallochaperone HypA [Bacteroidetes bacterium]|jgi:hydrogenase nickel incorporation protein HypA/HybF|nr:hydrogenase maturation nickel metallochaperone HypA [Bacteroidota bacterium]MCL5034356.1 hydrogenase maturation nickel metallochaperone HypA [Bacteroidota bacterium]